MILIAWRIQSLSVILCRQRVVVKDDVAIILDILISDLHDSVIHVIIFLLATILEFQRIL